jgi:tetraacyldisaccharide 4'-kinase
MTLVHAPEFWARDGLVPLLLQPVAVLYAAAGCARRGLTRPERAPVPVICVGNLVAGGAGKTPVALDLTARLAAAGRRPHIVTRGYGGTLSGPVAVDPEQHDTTAVGDEALLLSRAAPCWIARDRIAGARRAAAAGADVVLLDDGFQNPTIVKDLSLVVVDGGYGFGNGRVMPAGPLRERIADGLARADVVVILGADECATEAAIGGRRPVLHARLVPQGGADLAGQSVLAFAGIGRPAKFYATLRELGVRIVATRDFPDHHPYRLDEIEQLLRDARTASALAVTTEKDWVRLPGKFHGDIQALAVAVEWEEPARLDELLSQGRLLHA